MLTDSSSEFGCDFLGRPLALVIFCWLSIKTLTGCNGLMVAARSSYCAALLDSSTLGMFSQTASSTDRVAIDINGVTDGGSHHC
jgi:hypothetical protein